MNQHALHQQTTPVIWSAVAEMPFGRIGIQTEMYEQSLVLSNVVYLGPKERLIAPQNQLAESAIQQINQYCQDPNFVFNLPTMFQGSLHQQRVWRAIEKIPCGQVMTYGELAKEIKSAPRAVGGACAANPYPLIVPCHRIVAANGIGGFARQNERGYHRNIKQWLLKHEGALSHES
jgi:methylated-DNA-[protein]-cysteine S-methyltransferase